MTTPNGPYGDATGYHVARVMEKYAAPEPVLGAPVEHLTDRPAVRNGYADDARLYPVHSPAAAWVSAAFYWDSGDANQKTAGELAAALRTHRLFGEWDRMGKIEAADRTVKAAAAEPARYALPAERRYPIDTPARVARATAYFMDHHGAMDAAARRTYAGELTKAAGDWAGVPAATVWRVEAEAGHGHLAHGWRRVFADRVKLAGAAGRADLVEALDKAAAFRPADPVELANLLRDVDRATGWDLPDPLTQIVDDTPGTAARKLAGAVRSASGKWYEKAALTRVPDAVLRDMDVDDQTAAESRGFGLPFTSDRLKEELLGSEKTAALIEALLADAGVQPLAQDPPARPDWAALAAGTRAP